MKIKISDEINLVAYPDGDVAISEPGEDFGIVLHANELDKIAEHARGMKKLKAEYDQAIQLLKDIFDITEQNEFANLQEQIVNFLMARGSE